MPRGTPLSLKCPKCRRGQWRAPRAVRGVKATGRVEKRISRSRGSGYGGGGPLFTGHRGEVECLDCGHKWWSTHPHSGRVRCWKTQCCDMCATERKQKVRDALNHAATVNAELLRRLAKND
jgi:hypothetical protein